MAKPRPTFADYVVIAISPALIMTLVGSLVFFLIEVFYQGQFQTRLQFIFGLFVMATVLIGRISIEEGRERAGLFAIPLAVLTVLATFRFVQFTGWIAQISPVINIGLVALIWWCADRLTWDCTVIDDQEDASGEGLLQTAGLETAGEDEAEAEDDVAEEPLGTTAEELNKMAGGLWARFVAHRRRAHAPGVWVVYFSIPALLIFGFGQAGIFHGGERTRDYVFKLLVVYVASALGLLMTTSFLGLRRYLRQRRLQMPVSMAATWMTFGAIMIAVLLLFCMMLPRSNPVFEMAALAEAPANLLPSDFGFGSDGPDDDDAKRQAERDDAQRQSEKPGESDDGEGRQSDRGKKESGQGQDDNQQQGPRENAQSQQKQSGDQGQQEKSDSKNQQQQGQQRSQQQQKQQQDQQNPRPSDQQQQQRQNDPTGRKPEQQPSQQQKMPKSEQKQQQSKQPQNKRRPNEADSERTPQEQPHKKQQQNRTQRQQEELDQQQQKKKSQQQKQSKQNQKQTNEQQKQAEQRNENAQQKQQQEQEKRQSEQSKKNDSQKQQDKQSKQEQQQRKSREPPDLSKLTENLGGLFAWLGKALYWLLIVVGVIYVLWKYGAKIREAVANFIQAVRNFWKRLFGRRDVEVALDEEAAPAAAPPPPFSAYPDPFGNGQAERQPAEELVRYTFAAFEAWSREHGIERQPEETPHELAQLVGQYHVEVGPHALRLAELYSITAYAKGGLPPTTLRLLRDLWVQMTAHAETAAV